MQVLVNGLMAMAAIALLTTACLADEVTPEQFDRVVAALEVPEPAGKKDPLALRAAVVASDPAVGDPVIVVLKLRMLPGWYIYDYVPATQPFIETEWILNAGPGLKVVANWAGPPSTPHKSLPDTRMHASGPRDLLFFREMEVASADVARSTIDVGIRYQICNPEVCLPPRTKTESLTVDLSQAQ